MIRHVKIQCKNCGCEMFEGMYSTEEYEELKGMMRHTKSTACCGKFEHGAFPVLAFYSKIEEVPCEPPKDEVG